MTRKKEDGLRKLVKLLVASLPSAQYHLSWIESHYTSPGAPDLNYCCDGVEGWLELKAGPDLEVRASQVIWMEERIKAGGRPLFLIQWGDRFHIVPGSAAQNLRDNPSRENIEVLSTTVWTGGIPPEEFFNVLRRTENEHETRR